MDMNLLVSTDRNYLRYLRVLMVSVYENHPHWDVHFYVLHDELSEADEAYLNETAGTYGQKVSMLPVDVSLFEEFPCGGRWPRSCLYILMAHGYLPEELDRVLALDIDVAVDGDLGEFYSQEFDDTYLIASKVRYKVAEEPPDETILFEMAQGIDKTRASRGGVF